MIRRAHNLNQNLFNELPVRLRVKLLIKRQDWTRALQTIASQLQLFHRVHVLQRKLNRRPMRLRAQPHERVLFLVHFQVHYFITVADLGYFAQLVQTMLPVEFAIVFCVRHECFQVVDDVARQIANSSRVYEQNALLILPFFLG